MKLIKQSIDPRTLSGSVTLLPTTAEDMWSAHNLISPRDRLRASAIRRVTTQSATGSTVSSRVHTTLTLAITAVDFDARASELHVSGRVASENAHVKMGQFHTLDLELNRNFTLEKEEGWDSVALQTLKEACDTEKRAEVWAVLIEEGTANLCVVSDGTTVVRQTVTTRMGDKSMPGYGSGVEKFFRKVLDTLVRAVNFEELRPVLVASSGYTGQKFLAFVKEQSMKTGGKGKSGEGKELRMLLDKIVLEKAGNSGLGGLKEVLASPGVQKRLSDTRFARETGLLDKVFERIRKDDGRVVYGHKEVEQAVDAGAVGRGGGVLLISDELFRSLEIRERKRWVSLVDRVRDKEGGEVRVLSSMHESGERLKGVGGVAALLTFPMFDEDELEGGAVQADGREADGFLDSDQGDPLGELEM
ncbi:Protein pelota [Sphaceloma murrayae]|uniref:Protein DOM34 homolog n=1 Tax=Sphaceloma murrayae TaxID=2082308 RepID=A0A2K1QGH6_9PEZI|nr:Protein pelota [Sphaceloma murrayae]